MATFDLGAPERGDDEARIGLALRPFGLADDAASAAPALARRMLEVLEAPRRLAGPLAFRASPLHLPFDLRRQPTVAGQLLFGARRAVDVGAPQLGRQQVPAAGHVTRQVAVIVVIAVEEAAFLVTVQRVVRRVEVEHDLTWCPPMGLHEQIDQKALDRRSVVADLVILRRLRLAQIQPVQRALAGNRRAVRPLGLELTQQHRQQRTVSQMVVVVEVPS